MSDEKNAKMLLGSGLLLAVTSSLCCIVPLLTIIGSAGSIAALFSWVAPLRSYLLALTALVLGLAFYQAYRPKKNDTCGCTNEKRKSRLQSKPFLWFIAIVSVLLSTFPYYGMYFQTNTLESKTIVNNVANVQEVVLHIQGMSCEACEGHVNNTLLQKKGVHDVNTIYAKGISIVKFDSMQISLRQLALAVERGTGYKVVP